MYKLTIETASLEEIFEAVSNLRTKATAVISNDSEPVKEKKTRKAKPEAEDAAPVAELVKDKEPVAAETGYEQVKTATLALIKEKGKATALEVLAKFEIKAATELKPADYDAYVQQVNIALAK